MRVVELVSNKLDARPLKATAVQNLRKSAPQLSSTLCLLLLFRRFSNVHIALNTSNGGTTATGLSQS